MVLYVEAADQFPALRSGREMVGGFLVAVVDDAVPRHEAEPARRLGRLREKPTPVRPGVAVRLTPLTFLMFTPLNT